LTHRLRVYSQVPLRFYDFCSECENVQGVKTLYRKHEKTAGINLKVRDHVLSRQTDTVNNAIESKAADLKTELAREMAVRELAQRRLVFFIKRLFPQYSPGWVHNDICRRLEKFMKDVEAKKAPRLILNVPPRHGKSAIASDYFPSWVLGHHPEWEIISTSYALQLSSEFSKNIRSRIKDDKTYRAIFPDTRLHADSQAVEAWRTTKGGAFTAAGAGGPILGKGAHVFIIDDPHKNDEEANSPVLREKINRWYSSTARTRLHPGGGMLIIQQRWHDDDLSGHQLNLQKELLEQGVPAEEIDNWEVVCYPAIAEQDEYLDPATGDIVRDPPPELTEAMRLLRRKGDALHPERYPIESLLRQKNVSPKEEWAALFQQNPVPDDGDFFSRHDLKFVPSLPGKVDDYTYFSAWDLAIGEKQANDWTVGVVGAVNADGDLFVVDMIRARMGTRQIIEAVLSFETRYPLFSLGMEDGQIKKTLWPLIAEQLTKRRSHVSIDETLKPVTDKRVRANPLRALTQHGRVYFLDQPFAQRAIDEMLRFPKGTHDDIVDALAWLARMSKSVPLPQVRGAKGKKKKSWKDKLRTGGNRSGPGSYMTA
jgi:predicted phage terminase large subunit-like protein